MTAEEPQTVPELIEAATGRNAETLLRQLGDFGLTVVPQECRHMVNPKHEHAPCSTCDAPAFYQDMGFYFHCDDGTSSQSWCERPKPGKRWWQR